MNPFTHMADWLRRDRTAPIWAGHDQAEQRLRDELHAEAEQMFPGTTETRFGDRYDCAAGPPCDPEDGWICLRHRCWGCGQRHGVNQPCQPRGRHHRRQSEGHQVILASVTDLRPRQRAR